MSSAVSYEYLVSIEEQPNGLATLDGTGKIPVSQLPAGSVETYKGQFATQAALTTAYPTASLADYAYVTGTTSFWYWNAGLTTPAWANQNVTAATYNALPAAAKASMPYIIIP